MPILVVENLTKFTLGLGDGMGLIPAQSTKEVEVTVSELDLLRDELVSLSAGGSLRWSTSDTPTVVDNYSEFMTIDKMGSTSVLSYPTSTTGRWITHVLTGPQNDYTANGRIDDVNLIRMAPGFTPKTVSGISGHFPGRVLYLSIITLTGNTVTLLNESASSLPENRFALPGAANMVIGRNQGVKLWYDEDPGRWRVLSSST